MTVIDIPRSALSQGELIASVIGQLADAGAFLATTEGVRVSSYGEAVIWYFAAEPAEVDEIAAAIGAEAAWDDEHTQYSVTRKFGPEVVYKAVYIRKDREDAGAPVPAQAVAA